MLEVLDSLQSRPIEELSLGFKVKKEEISALGAFIGKLTRLRVLKLEVNSSLQHTESDILICLLQSFSQLRCLEALDLRMNMKRPRTDPKMMKGVLCAFAKMISCLPRLQELSFKFSRGDYSGEMEHLLGSLTMMASNLKRLELDFESTKFEVMGLIELLLNSKLIEVLTLRGLMVSDQRVLEALSRLISGAKKLRSLDLSEIVVERENERFLGMLEGMWMKKGLERFYCKGTMTVDSEESGKDLGEILKGIDYLDLLKMSNGVWKFIVKDERFFNYKWE